MRSTSNMANWPPRPRSLARYMATSASCSRSSRDLPYSLRAMPMLMVATTSCPALRVIGSRSDVEDGRGDVAGVVGRGQSLQQDDELVAAEARQRVARTHGTAQAVADDAQQLVAHLVARGCR